MVQFKAAAPNFYEEYFAARVMVDNRGARAEDSSVTPANPDSLDKAA